MTESRSGTVPRAGREPGAPCWIWPFRHRRSTADQLWELAGRGGWERGFRVGWFAVAAGLIPYAAGWWLGLAWQQAATAALLFIPFVALVRHDALGRAVALIGLGFAAHSVLAIVASHLDPQGAADVMPGAEEYWRKQEAWIRTGQDPEYEVRAWLYAHLQLLGGIGVFSYTSFGFVPLLEGFQEVDLMNYYVGRLSAISRDRTMAVLVGWHLWSVLRGIAYTFLVFEVTSWSLSRLWGREPSTPRRRRWRWGTGLGFFACDCVLKYLTLGTVREQLFENLHR